MPEQRLSVEVGGVKEGKRLLCRKIVGNPCSLWDLRFLRRRLWWYCLLGYWPCSTIHIPTFQRTHCFQLSPLIVVWKILSASKKPAAFVFCPEDRYSRFLRNVENHVSNHTVSYPPRRESSRICMYTFPYPTLGDRPITSPYMGNARSSRGYSLQQSEHFERLNSYTRVLWQRTHKLLLYKELSWNHSRLAGNHLTSTVTEMLNPWAARWRQSSCNEIFLHRRLWPISRSKTSEASANRKI
jgi:hypothetical protein